MCPRTRSKNRSSGGAGGIPPHPLIAFGEGNLIRRGRFVSAAVLLILLAPVPSFAHYPFPCSREEKDAAARIEQAVQTRNQSSAGILTKLLGDKNPRVQTAALLGIMQLSTARLDFGAAEVAIGGLKDAKHAFVMAGAEAARILLDKGTPVKERATQLVKLTQNKEGYHRRMATEALRQMGDASVLPALEALANDGFGDHDDRFDMKAVARVAFEVWWPIRSAGLAEEEKLPVLIDTLRLGEPFSSRWCDAACDLLEKEGEKAVPLLIPVAKSGDRRSKLWARRTLRHVGTKEAADALLEVCAKDLESEDRLLRRSAASTLSRLPDKRVLPMLANALAKNRDPNVRERAAFAIGRIDDEGAIVLLRAALSDPDEVVKTQAAAQVARKGLGDGDQILLKALGCREGAAGSIAVGAMAYISDQSQLTERVVELLQKQPSEEEQSGRQRTLFEEMRNRILRELASWDVEKLRPMAVALKAVLLKQRESGWAKSILRKLGQ